MKRKTLGRGLESLIPRSTESKKDKEVLLIDIIDIIPNKNQPRKHFDKEKLEELAKSIKSKGVLQPIIVEKLGNKYQIIAGERRWRAAGLANLKKIPAIVFDQADEKERLEIGLIENIQRESLNPLEMADSISFLMSKFGYTHEQVAEVIGKSRTAVTNTLRLLQLDETTKEALRSNLISEGHARALLSIEDLSERKAVLKEIIEKGLSVREVEKKAKQKKGKSKKSDEKDIFLKSLCEELESRFQTKVDIKMTGKKGKIIINFSDSNELEKIINMLRGEL